MAIFHHRISTISKAPPRRAGSRPAKRGNQSAALKHDYIAREGKYGSEKMAAELDLVESQNMPEWATEKPYLYWQACDEFERANGRRCVHIECALPRELNDAERKALARAFAEKVTTVDGGRLPYTLAFHKGCGEGGKGDNPHFHLMFSERVNDGLDRPRLLWFKRVATSPRQKGDTDEQYQARQAQLDYSRGGARKTAQYQAAEFVVQNRELWAEMANAALSKAGKTVRIDHRSYEAQGKDLVPTIHVGRNSDREERKKRNEEILEINERISAITTELQQAQASIEGMPLSKIERFNQMVGVFRKGKSAKTTQREFVSAVLDAMYLDDRGAGLGRGSKLLDTLDGQMAVGDVRNASIKQLCDLNITRAEDGARVYLLTPRKGSEAAFLRELDRSGPLLEKWGMTLPAQKSHEVETARKAIRNRGKERE